MSLYYSQFLLDTAFLSVLIELDKVPLDLDSEPLVLPSLDIGSTCQVTSHLLRWHLAGIGFLLKGTPSSLPILLMLFIPRNLSCPRNHIFPVKKTLRGKQVARTHPVSCRWLSLQAGRVKD